MVDVNRTPYNSIPEEWAFHPTIGPFIRDILTQLGQTRDRVGGDTDAVSEITVRESYPWPQRVNSDKGDRIASLYSSLPVASDKFRAVSVSSDYTAIPYDFINAKSKALITFPAQPKENSVIIIRNGDGSKISLNGNGKNINGSSTGAIVRQGTCMYFHYFIDTDEWLVR